MEKIKYDDDSDAGTTQILDIDEDDRSDYAEVAQKSEIHEEERVHLSNNTIKSIDDASTKSERSLALCFFRVRHGLISFSAIALYLFLWVVNATLLQGIASGSLSENAYNKPYFLTYFDHNFHMLSFIPVCWYVKCYRNYSIMYYLKDVWARRGGLKRSLIVCVFILYILTFQNVFYIMGLDCVNVPTANAVYQLQTGFTIIMSIFVFGDFFTDGQAIGLVVSLVGVVLIVLPPLLSQHNTEEPDDIDPRLATCHNELSLSAMAFGILATAGSAVLWGAFQVGWRWQFESRHNKASSQNMTKLEGVIDTMTTLSFLGFTNLLVGWPFVLMFHFMGIEKFEFPVPSQWGLIIFSGFIEYLFDFSCTLAIYITSPIMTAITAPLVIPLGLLSDYLIYETGDEARYIWWYLGGSVFVLVGTVLVEAKPKFFRFKDKNSEIKKLLEAKAVGSPANVC